jgi:hypothetical protein
MDTVHDMAFTYLTYAFGELCLADREPLANKVLGFVQELRWDDSKVESYRPAMADNGTCPATGRSMEMVHLGSGLGYLEAASAELQRLGMTEHKRKCDEVVKEGEGYIVA